MFKRILTYSILGLVALGGFFGNIHIETKQGENNIVTISYERSTTYAAFTGPCPAGQTPGATKCEPISTSVDLYNGMIDKINIVLAVLSAMISPIILFVGWLMSPDWTSGDVFGIRKSMYLLWVTVSNIVYFVYAVLLILIALGTMFNQDKFSYKVMLPKLALGILMVPFTWMFVQATISLANIVTGSVMTIPAETIKTGDSIWFTTASIPTIITIDNTGTGTKSSTASCDSSAGPVPCISPKEFLTKASGIYGPLVVYGYSIFKFEKINRLEPGLDYAKAALQIVHTSIVSAIMFLVFGILILALAVILLVRAIKLWIYAIFSPLFTFRFVAGSNIMGSGEDTFTVKEFIGLAFLPAIIGLTLSFGLIMINAVHGPGAEKLATNPATKCSLLPGSSTPCKIGNIMGSTDNSITRTIKDHGTDNATTNTEFKFGGLSFNFLGKATNQTSTESTSTGTLDAVGGMFGTLIIDVIALVFIWISFMAAKNVSKAVGAVAQPFEDMGKKIGSLAMSMPKYAPILPASMGGSISGMSKTVEGLSGIPEARSRQKFENSETGKWIQKQLGGNANATKLATTQQKIQNGTPKEIQDDLRQYNANDHKDVISTLNKNSEALKLKLDKIGELGLYKEDIMKIINDPNASTKDKLKVQAALQSGTWRSLPDNEKGLTDMINNTAKQGATGGSSGATGVATKVNDSTINLNTITDKVIQINTTDGGKKVIFEAKDAEKIKGKNATMTEEGFRDSLMTSGTMTEEGIADLINKMKAANNDFFKK